MAREHWRDKAKIKPNRPDRNYENIDYGAERMEIEAPFNALHDDLTECYYKHWKLGDFVPWFDHKPENIKDAKSLFDKLHGLIFHALNVAMADEKGIAEYQEKKEDSIQKLQNGLAQGDDILSALEEISDLKISV